MAKHWLIVAPLLAGGALVGALAGQGTAPVVATSLVAASSGLSGLWLAGRQQHSAQTELEKQLAMHERHIEQLERRLELKDRLIQHHEKFQHHFVSRVSALSQRALPSAAATPGVPLDDASVLPDNVVPFRQPDQPHIVTWLNQQAQCRVNTFEIATPAPRHELDLATVWLEQGWQGSINKVLAAIAKNQALEFRGVAAQLLTPLLQRSPFATVNEASTEHLRVTFTAASIPFWRGGWLRGYVETVVQQALPEPLFRNVELTIRDHDLRLDGLFWWQDKPRWLQTAAQLTPSQLDIWLKQCQWLGFAPEQLWLVVASVPPEAARHIRDRYGFMILGPQMVANYLEGTPRAQVL